MFKHKAFKFICLWLASSIGSLTATVNPALSSKELTKLAPAALAHEGGLHREARDYGGDGGVDIAGGGGGAYSNYRPYERPSSRCISCLYAAMGGGNQDRDRYYDQFYYNSRPAYGGGQREYEDRNWYYQPDRYDERNRYPDRNSASFINRNDDRYYQQNPNRYDNYYRPTAGGGGGGYDRNDYRQNAYNEYRGNGYDNRDPMYFNALRGAGTGASAGGSGYDSAPGYYDDRLANRGYSSSGFMGGSTYSMRPSGQPSPYGNSNRDRYSGNSYESRYPPEYYDRNAGYRGGYDDRGFQPWDQTNRGVSGFDNTGRGHYYSNYNNINNPAQPPLPSSNPHQQSPPRPFQESSSGHQNHHQSPIAPPSTQYQNQQQQQQQHQQQHQQEHNQQSYESSDSGSQHHGNSEAGKESYAGGWNYAAANDRNNGQQHQQQHEYGANQDKQQSAAYGGERPGQRPLGTSYLHERDTPTVISTGNHEGGPSDAKIENMKSKNPSNDTNTVNNNDAAKTTIDDNNNNSNTSSSRAPNATDKTQ